MKLLRLCARVASRSASRTWLPPLFRRWKKTKGRWLLGGLGSLRRASALARSGARASSLWVRDSSCDAGCAGWPSEETSSANICDDECSNAGDRQEDAKVAEATAV